MWSAAIYTVIFTLMAIFLVVIAIIGGVLMPELGEKGKLAQQARERQTIDFDLSFGICCHLNKNKL